KKRRCLRSKDLKKTTRPTKADIHLWRGLHRID
ncbi:MAG: hypothetical protein ACI9QL_002964, partial [Candidatus Omnitrophota bacterium]